MMTAKRRLEFGDGLANVEKALRIARDGINDKPVGEGRWAEFIERCNRRCLDIAELLGEAYTCLHPTDAEEETPRPRPMRRKNKLNTEEDE